MNDLICSWASAAMYRDQLVSAELAYSRCLADIIQSKSKDSKKKNNKGEAEEAEEAEKEKESAQAVLLLIDTSGCDLYEDDISDEKTKLSHRNQSEATLVDAHVRDLLDPSIGGLDPSQIGVITPYNGQLELLRDRLKPDFPKLDIKTVDSFRGAKKRLLFCL